MIYCDMANSNLVLVPRQDSHFDPILNGMKILVANIGSTSLKWRLFDFSNSAERLLHKGGFERVTDYPKAIEDCLAELKKANAIQSENELSAVGFKTVIAKNVTGCVRLDERVLQAMERLQRPRARAQSALHHRHQTVRATDAERAAHRTF